MLTKYLKEAVRIEESGQRIDFEQGREVELPLEFQDAIDHDPALRDAFAALTPGRQRAYLLHFAGAK
ncbi:hypothetical protein Pla123a_40590 [Posidoniimonas polymericola]|uniref:Uncharacterized protein n=1 Tax=Posidoniimonas polymericola TaxID=2528002 RepID=A0A5C5YBJ9_9BACT|nr:hypothetical protein Pla123a_40590 [Posidoniimonas polymericola]